MQPYIGRVQYYLRVVMPEADGTRTCRLAVCQFYEPQPTQQDLYVIKLSAPCPTLEVADIDSIDCVLCHGRPQDTVKGKRKRRDQSDAADVGNCKVFLWRYHNLSRMA